MFQLIIFDMDGLMFDTERLTCNSFLKKMASLGIKATVDDFRLQLGLKKSDNLAVYRQLYGDVIDPETLYEEVGKDARAIMERDGVPEKRGLKELISAINQRGLKKTIASGSSREVIWKNLKSTDLEGEFTEEDLISAIEIEHGKPAPDIFLALCQRFDVDPKDALVLEDSPNGIQAAINGGIPVIAVPDLAVIPEDLADQCLTVADSLLDVIPVIEKNS